MEFDKLSVQYDYISDDALRYPNLRASETYIILGPVTATAQSMPLAMAGETFTPAGFSAKSRPPVGMLGISNARSSLKRNTTRGL